MCIRDRRRVPELIPVLGSQPADDVSHKPGGRLPLLSARPAVTLATLKSFILSRSGAITEFQVKQRHCLCAVSLITSPRRNSLRVVAYADQRYRVPL